MEWEHVSVAARCRDRRLALRHRTGPDRTGRPHLLEGGAMARTLSRTPHAVWVPVTAAAVLAAGVGAAVALHHTDPTRLPTTLQVAAGATVTTPDGRTHPGLQGETLAPGSVVQAAGDRSAERSALPASTAAATQRLAVLETDGRKVTLGTGSRVQVVDGADMVVEAGSLVSDRRHGPALHLRSDSLQVSQLSGVIRVDHDSSTRVAAYDGRADLTNSSGRHLGVSALHQAIAAGLGLPQGQSPLQLRDDALDMAGDTVMVSLDQRLRSKASAVDADPKVTEVLSVVPVKATRSAPPSEAVLPYVLGRAGRGAPEAERVATAVAYRTGGGSWGAVARLVSADASGVDTAYAALVDQLGRVGGTTPPRGTVLAGRSPSSVPRLGGSTTPLSATTPSLGAGGLATPGVSTPAGTVPGTPTTPNGPTSPPQPPGLLGGVLSVVQGVVGLLPGASSHAKGDASVLGGVVQTVGGAVGAVTGVVTPGTVTTAGDASPQARADALHADDTALSRLLRHPVSLTPVGDVGAGKQLSAIVEQVRPALAAVAAGTATPAQQAVAQQVTAAVTAVLQPTPPAADPAELEAARRAAAQAAQAAAVAAARAAAQQAQAAQEAAQRAAQAAAHQQTGAQAQRAAARQALIDQFNRRQAQEWDAAVGLARQAPPAFQQVAQQRLQAFAAQLAAQRAAAAAWLASQP
jgi:hypothetical protein